MDNRIDRTIGGMRQAEFGKACGDTEGMLPSCAPLANPYVPFQQSGSAKYEPSMAFVRGTLFPGLDLPFMGMVNKKEKSGSLTSQMQALAFAINELVLYLDTHPSDKEALTLMRQYVQVYERAQEELVKRDGPQTVMQVGSNGSYDWTKGPWPWEYRANKEG